MVVAVFLTTFPMSGSAQDLYHHEDVKSVYIHDAGTLFDACDSLSRPKAEHGSVQMCAWTRRLPMDKTGCPAYQFTTGYVPGHIRGCLLGPNVAVCSCRSREECFKYIDNRPIRGTNYSLSAVQYELQCIRDEWLHPRIKREGEDGGGSSENPPDSTQDVKTTTTTEPQTTITKPETTTAEPKTTTTTKEETTTTTATTTTTPTTTTITTTITTTTATTTTTEEETTATEEEEEEETTTEQETTTTITTTKKSIVRPPTTTDDQDYEYTDYVAKKTKGVTSTKKATTTDEGDYYTDDGGDDYNGKTTKGGKRTKRPKPTEKGGEGAEEDKQTFLIRENRTAFMLTILGAFASTLLLLIIIVIKMWFKLERRERIRDIQKEARKTKKSMRARRR
ncbi:hypothetical protein V3C99_016364 [Haemonchus contortus]